MTTPATEPIRGRLERSFTVVRQSNASLLLIAKQTEVQEWIQNVLHEQFPSQDFASSLDDGILLCRLIQAIKPGFIKKINTSKLKYKMIENVGFFVAACKEMGVKANVLPDPIDLCERRNMMKFVNCIHSLAEIAASQGFQPQMETLLSADAQTISNTMKNQNTRTSVRDFAEIADDERKKREKKKVAIQEPAKKEKHRKSVSQKQLAEKKHQQEKLQEEQQEKARLLQLQQQQQEEEKRKRAQQEQEMKKQKEKEKDEQLKKQEEQLKKTEEKEHNRNKK